MKSENACCHSVLNLLSSCVLSKSITIAIYKIIILPVVLYECVTISHLGAENIRTYEGGSDRRLKKWHNEAIHYLLFHHILLG
jgi:hypothetical protein